jgi:hypothetical protein
MLKVPTRNPNIEGTEMAAEVLESQMMMEAIRHPSLPLARPAINLVRGGSWAGDIVLRKSGLRLTI